MVATPSVDNSEWVMQGVIRDPQTGALLRVNADGSINVSGGGGAGAGTGFTSASTAGTAMVGTLSTNGLSLGIPAWLTTAAAAGGAGTGFTTGATAGTAVVGTLSTNGLSLNVPAFITTARASTDGLGLNTAGTNITWTANSAGVSINAAGYAGTVTAITGNASLTLNSAGLSFNGSNLAGVGTTVGSTAGTVAAFTLNSAGLSFLNPEPVISSYENFVPGNFVAQTWNGASVSAAAAFQLPQAGSFSFIRIPVLMTTNSTTLASTGASMSASVAQYTTFNAVVYSLGTGANSQSLQSVASGSAGITNMNSISVLANGTQYTITQIMTFPALGFNTSTQSTAYSISNTNYSFSSAIQTVFSTERFLDIPFAASLSAGPYWLIIGYSSSSASNSTGVSAASNANVFYSQHHAQSVVNVAAWGIMGSTNIASGAGLGLGSFSTVGGGTTNSLPISAISSSQSHARMYFQMLRNA